MTRFLCSDCGEPLAEGTCPGCVGKLRSALARACEEKTVQRPDRSRRLDFLRFAKGQSCACCICHAQAGSELHHFGPRGLGQKGDDLMVARVCPACHKWAQGKRAAQWGRLNRMDVWAAILEDGITLLAAFVRQAKEGAI